ncbi:MAG: hypothetical protein UT33_C0007G0079 [Candidatus Peregrinibacteria bacterium GW2011_GWC2_39_14]|nr:MAG: hypothetical protein US92_C0002G0080 [Candidatus Peregrinibacteria bacterium GW2011_GWA2_38_36]KKR06891.1 MAG: hypothetical protein UT33_C0007G0079 [Candidatus Peregrinibacteria bacterium GW2011_GWC2_39_14]
MNATPHKQYLRYDWQIARKSREREVQNPLQASITEIPSIKFEINSGLLIASFILFIALITMMTLFFAGKGVTKGYIVKQLEAERQTLIRENDVIGGKLASAQSADSLLLSRRAKTMVKLNESRITFIRAESNLAQR